MEVKTIFVKDKLLRELENNIHDATALVTELGEVVKNQFPNLKWDNALLWIIIQKAEVRDYFCLEMAKKAAKNANLSCEYDRKDTGNLSQSVIVNRKINEAAIAKELGIIKKIGQLAKYGDGLKDLSTYLRSGAIFIAADGWVTIAENYVDLLKTYCSVTVENKAEAAFANTVEAMREHAAQIKQAHAKLAELAATPQGKKDIADCDYMADRLLVGSRLRLSSDSAVWRALVTFVAAHRSKDVARFFNAMGIPKFDVKEVYDRTGFLPDPTPGLRIKYPELYKNVAYRGDYSSASRFDDTPEGVNGLRQYMEQLKTNGVYDKVYLGDDGEIRTEIKKYQGIGVYAIDGIFTD